MNRRRALLASLLLLIPAQAEEITYLAFVEHVNELPACDRVEVVRIKERFHIPEKEAPDPEKMTDDQKKRLYYLKLTRSWADIAGTVTVKNAEAERLAGYFRAFKQHIFPPGVGVSFCHTPPYLYRFYSGEKLLGEATVCWDCENLIVGPPDKRTAMYFKPEIKEVKQLLEASNKLFPNNPAK